jgi:hypothetical protein
MNPLAIAVAALPAGLPDGAVSGTLGVAPSPAEVIAGLGALVVAMLGVLVVRYLQAPSDGPRNPVVSPDPTDERLGRAA